MSEMTRGRMWTGASLATVVLIVALGGYLVLSWQLPDVRRLTQVSWQTPLKVYTEDGQLLAEYGQKHRVPVKISDVPKPLIQAVLATEDQRFYEHNGVDFIGLMRAVIRLVVTGHKSQGASTITMQVARNFFLSPEKTYSRKLREILLAIKIDRELSKSQILELYLNKIFLGQRAYGVAAAARSYYNKSLNELTLPQMAMIAGLPKAPSKVNPVANPKRALARRNHVLSRMLEHGMITKDQYDQASKAPITAGNYGTRIAVSAPYVAEFVRRLMVARWGDEAYTRGFRVTTTLDSRLQRVANLAVIDGLLAFDSHHGWRPAKVNLVDRVGDVLVKWRELLAKLPHVNDLVPAAVMEVKPQAVTLLEENGRVVELGDDDVDTLRSFNSFGYRLQRPRSLPSMMKVGDVVHIKADRQGAWHLAQLPEVQAALVATRRFTGDVVAMVGGWNYNLSRFNRVTQAWRQPGSCMKPFLYAAALDKGYTLASVVNDAPVVMPDSGENALWRPENDSQQFHGPTRLRVGLIHSRNLVSVRLLRSIGLDYGLGYLKRFGFSPDKQPHGLSLALGAGSVTPWQLNQAMAVFAQQGQLVPSRLIERVVDEDGHDWTSELLGPVEQGEQVIGADNAFLIHSALQDVIRLGTGRRAKALHRADLAGKTGTTNNKVDAWFSGYGGDVVATVWVGYDDMRPLHAYGSKAALPLWMRFMGKALRDQPIYVTPQPPGVVTARIDPATGLLARPEQVHSIFEYFRQSHQPGPSPASDAQHSASGGQALLHELY